VKYLIPGLLASIALITAFAVGCGTQAPVGVELFLEVTGPEDESEVATSTIAVSGTTIPDAVVSVWVDSVVEIAEVDEDGNFSVMVNLEEGPNIIEVIASDWEGNEESTTLIVFYIP